MSLPVLSVVQVAMACPHPSQAHLLTTVAVAVAAYTVILPTSTVPLAVQVV
jgi:hypothetical protein